MRSDIWPPLQPWPAVEAGKTKDGSMTCLQHAATTCDWGFPVYHDFSWCQRLCLKFRKLIDDDFGVTGNSEPEQHEATHRYDQIGFRYQGYLIDIT